MAEINNVTDFQLQEHQKKMIKALERKHKVKKLKQDLKKQYWNLIEDIKLLDKDLFKSIIKLIEWLDYKSACRKVESFIRRKENEKNVAKKVKVKSKLFDDKNIVCSNKEYLIYKLSSQKEYEINWKFLMSNCIWTNYIYKEWNNYDLYLLTTWWAFKNTQDGKYSFDDYKDSNNFTITHDNKLTTMYAYDDKEALSKSPEWMIDLFFDYILSINIKTISVSCLFKYISVVKDYYSEISWQKYYKVGTIPKLYDYIEKIWDRIYWWIWIDFYYNHKDKELIWFIIWELYWCYRYIINDRMIDDKTIEISYEINDIVGSDILKLN